MPSVSFRPDQEIISHLNDLGVSPSTRLGQNFLRDMNLARKQVRLSGIEKDDTVLEVGPGLGILTLELANRAKRVLAVEVDPSLATHLEIAMPENVQVIRADILKWEPETFDLLVANLPYSISSPIIFKLIQLDFRGGAIMVQKEFADRLVAVPGTKEYGRLTVSVGANWDCRRLFNVPAEAFYPRPKVDSVVVGFTAWPDPPFPMTCPEIFRALVKVCFAHRRKKLRNNLKAGWRELGLPREDMEYHLEQLEGLDRRAQELTPEEFGELSLKIESLKG